jgi:hypothetical protein
MSESRPEEPSAAVMSALTTEHFVLQGMAGTSTSEALGRSSLYFASLSSGLVAIGFAGQRPELLDRLLPVVLLVVVILGLLTTARLVDTGIQNIRSLEAISRIRARYRQLAGPDGDLFAPWSEGPDSDDNTQALSSLGTRAGWRAGWSTAASVVAMVNAVVTGTGVMVGLGKLHWPTAVNLALAVLVAAGYLMIFYRWQDGRYRTATSWGR